MKTERIVLSFVAVLIGLLVAGIAFYFYQMTKTLPSKNNTIAIKITPTPTPDLNQVLTVTNPTDGEVTGKKVITVSGRTEKNSTIIVSSNDADQVVSPSGSGDFSLTITLDDGVNLLYITSIFPDGTEKRITRTVTYTTEQF